MVFALAAIIGLVLFQQVESDGLDEAPWLIGLLVIGGLLFVALSSTPSAPSKGQSTSPKSKSVEAEFLDAYTHLASFLKAATNRNVPLEVGEMRSELLKQADEVGLKFAFAVHWLAIARQSPEAQNGPEAKALLYTAAGNLTETIANGLRQYGERENIRPRAVKAAARELAEYQKAAVQVAKAFAIDQPNPVDPLYRIVEQQLPLGHKTAEAREKFFGPTVRQLWRTLEGRD